ncbi:MAG: futalosine hydrolase, partial [Bacteroidota bacterium]
MKILIVAATPFEVQPLRDMLEQSAVLDQQAFYQLGLLRIRFLITGVGMLATSYHLTGALHESDYELVINAGVAGSFKTDFPIGTVVNVVSERIGDLGAEEADGQFIDLLEMGLQKHEAPPFESGVLHNAVRQNFLPLAQGLSVNKVHGAADSIARIRQKYDVDV